MYNMSLKKKILSTFFQKVTWFPHDMAEKIIAFFVFCNIQTGLEYSTIFQLFGTQHNSKDDNSYSNCYLTNIPLVFSAFLAALSTIYGLPVGNERWKALILHTEDFAFSTCIYILVFGYRNFGNIPIE
jgi:hypothetical protein